jgi:hypothetical protein
MIQPTYSCKTNGVPNMSGEMIQVAAKSASLFQRLKNVAAAHPVAAGVVGTLVAGTALVGTYKVAKAAFGNKPEKVEVTVKTEPGAEQAKS